MKATGIVRRVDDLGRIVIPKEIRRTLRIREGDPLLKILTPSDGYIWAMDKLLKRIGGKQSGGLRIMLCDKIRDASEVEASLISVLIGCVRSGWEAEVVPASTFTFLGKGKAVCQTTGLSQQRNGRMW